MIADLMKFNVIIIFNSPYSFEYAPIEEVFGYVKRKLIYTNNTRSSKDLRKMIINILGEI